MSKLHLTQNGSRILAKRIRNRVEWHCLTRGQMIAEREHETLREAKDAAADREKAATFALLS